MTSPSSSAAPPAQTIPPTPSAPQSCSPAPPLPPRMPALPAAAEPPDPAHQSAPHHATCEELPDEDDFTSASHTPASCPLTPSPTPTPVSVPPVLIPPNVSLISAQVFHMLMKQPNMQVFKLCLLDIDVHTHLAQATSNEPYDPLKGVPKEYHDFADIFSKSTHWHCLHCVCHPDSQQSLYLQLGRFCPS